MYNQAASICEFEVPSSPINYCQFLQVRTSHTYGAIEPNLEKSGVQYNIINSDESKPCSLKCLLERMVFSLSLVFAQKIKKSALDSAWIGTFFAHLWSVWEIFALTHDYNIVDMTLPSRHIGLRQPVQHIMFQPSCVWDWVTCSRPNDDLKKMGFNWGVFI